MVRLTRREALSAVVPLVFGPSLLASPRRAAARGAPASARFEAVAPPAWVQGVTRMAFVTAGDLDAAAGAGVQVVHTNLVWPYFPLRRDGGGLAAAEASAFRDLVEGCRRRGLRLVLGLPPFPSVDLVRAHPDWRVLPAPDSDAHRVEPRADNLGTRIGCNLGPWGDYLVALLAELLTDYRFAGYSFDGNYHPPLCHCPACRAAYRDDAGLDVPARIDLDDVAYRHYLVWRGERLEDHYRRIQAAIKGVDPEAVVMTWTTNAGRYGHLLTSPRVMSTRMNLLIDLPMQEWWLDETNQGASVAPAFGAAYLRALVPDRPSASEPYLMARGNPYGTDSFPRHERLVRTLLALTNGNIAAHSFGWPGHRESTADVFRAVADRAPWITHTRRLPWAALLMSEQTRQFVAYKDIAGRYLPHVFGAFRATLEEHRPLDLVNDWDITPEGLAPYRVLILPEAAALSDAQAAAVRAFVEGGGGLVATGAASLCDELGRPRPDFALADVFGVSFRGRADDRAPRTELDANFAATLGDDYWARRVGVARLAWVEHDLTRDPRLEDLVPRRSATFRGPSVLVSEPSDAAEVVARATPEGATDSRPALIARPFGRGRVAYLPVGIDAALWSYAYPYQRRLLDRALVWAASGPPGIRVEAPLAVQATFFTQQDEAGRRWIVHLHNGLDTSAHHGQPGGDVPLREESVPIHGIRVRFTGDAPARFHVEPGGIEPAARRVGAETVVELPPLDIHAMLVGEWG
jgi:hypothetical protein